MNRRDALKTGAAVFVLPFVGNSSEAAEQKSFADMIKESGGDVLPIVQFSEYLSPRNHEVDAEWALKIISDWRNVDYREANIDGSKLKRKMARVYLDEKTPSLFTGSPEDQRFEWYGPCSLVVDVYTLLPSFKYPNGRHVALVYLCRTNTSIQGYPWTEFPIERIEWGHLLCQKSVDITAEEYAAF